MTDETRMEIFSTVDRLCSDDYQGVSTQFIADCFTDYSRSQVYNALQDLVEIGALVKGDSNGRTNIYRPNPEF